MSTSPPPNSIHPLNCAEWRAWLAANHTRPDGVCLISYKQATGLPHLTYDEAVEEALCFGWVDSKSSRLDDERTMLWMAPRRPGSNWSHSNKERVACLLAAGLMTPAGLAKVEAAQRDGSWSALDAVEDLFIPPDLDAALDENPPARTHFEAFPRSVKRSILAWLASAKRPATRAQRIAETATLAAQNIRANQ